MPRKLRSNIASVAAVLIPLCLGPADLNATDSSVDEQLYTYSVCYKAKPGKLRELRTFLTETGSNLARAIIAESNQVAWGVSQAVIPFGEEAECDFMVARTYRGAPSELAASTDSSLKRAGIDRGEMSADFRSIARLVHTSLWRVVESVGEAEAGDFFTIDRMKVSAMADWIDLETKVFKPLQDQRAKDGRIKAWAAYQRVSPKGAALAYNAATINVVGSLDQIPSPGGYREAFAKVNPGLDIGAISKQVQEARSIVFSSVYQMLVRVGGR